MLNSFTVCFVNAARSTCRVPRDDHRHMSRPKLSRSEHVLAIFCTVADPVRSGSAISGGVVLWVRHLEFEDEGVASGNNVAWKHFHSHNGRVL
ncbi:hypothetical protein OWV82_009558 [Melia azedarach]|uniref:Uncharacterized protein n=1 Tax=Melia azedarach TaxID=155640 RepID=A0ACC1Y2W7_MELAZ|nr:hypothetical protein OWV82_009558 [Melia azedarach]